MLVIVKIAVPVEVKITDKSCVVLARDIEGNAVILGYNNLNQLKEMIKVLRKKIRKAEKEMKKEDKKK